MPIKIDKTRCHGCGGAAEPRCAWICPGDLLQRGPDGKACLRDLAACWDCAACLKECPRGALALYLPRAIGGRGSTLRARREEGRIIWELRRAEGGEEIFSIPNERVI